MDDLPAISLAQMEAVGGWTLGVLPHVRQRYRDDLRRVEEGIRPSLLPKQIGEESRPIIARDPRPAGAPAGRAPRGARLSSSAVALPKVTATTEARWRASSASRSRESCPPLSNNGIVPGAECLRTSSRHRRE